MSTKIQIVGGMVPQPDWNQTDETKSDYIKNKPALGAMASKDAVERTDLAEGVQVSLGKADTAIQSLDGYATETYVNTAVANVVNSAPETLDTLNELAAALDDDPNFATTVATQIGTKADQTEVDSLAENVAASMSLKYIWYANQDVVALASNPLVALDGGISSYKQRGNGFIVMAAKSVILGAIVIDYDSPTVTPSTVVGNYKVYNNGDILFCGGNYLVTELWQRIPMYEAKVMYDSSGNLIDFNNLMSTWDKLQVNKIPSLETTANEAKNLANNRLPIYPNPNPKEGWQTNWLFDQGWYLGGIKKDCGGHPPVLNENHTSWAILVLNGMATDAESLNHNHRLQIAFDVVNSKIYMRRGWMSSNDWTDSWTEASGTVETPVKGVDYWTEEDKAEIKAYVDEAILNGEW